jgi:hypothetical protein
VTLSAALAAGSAELAAQTTDMLKDRVVAAGLAPDEADLLVSMYSKPIFESEKLVVVFRLPQDEIDSKLIRLLILLWGIFTGKAEGFHLADEAKESMHLANETKAASQGGDSA